MDRYTVSAERYLSQHHVLVYLEDAVSQLLEHKEDNPKVNATKFFSDYFTSVREGNHTLYREYNFIRITPHNRSSFVRTIWKCFRHIGKKGDLLTIKEYHSLICLLCYDFPFDVVQKTARIILMEDAQDCLISFADFLYAFQIQFYYDEFLSKCSDVYKALASSAGRDTVVVPTSEDQANVHAKEEKAMAPSLNTEGVDSLQFFRALTPIIEKTDFSTPPLNALKEILSTAPRVSFYGFLMALAKCDIINGDIGMLPHRDDIYDGILEKDVQEVPTIRPSTARSTSKTKMSTRPVSGSAPKQTTEKKKVKTKRVARPRRTSVTTPSSSSSDSEESSDSDSSGP
ncbi:centriolar satellite-associated tubulin polyglutamylase complex regulator 1-like isoform X2 [Lineus longissimus]|uniref:centriolar satellite-associated tubulin polyglutamylase complex regulator 1-like isoform X2 n=1 Tax=Lineus longissimus TaxID=88925 RepID=UPI00315CA632